MRRKLRIGVLGVRRGNTYVKTLKIGQFTEARVTAICDFDTKRIQHTVENFCQKGRYAPKVFTDAEEFMESGLFDAVLLCNYFHEHADYAIRCLKKGIHVFSEIMAAPTMAKCVELCRAAEASKAVYMIAENYPYSRANLEMKRLYEGGTLGKLIFAEGEYVHMMGPKDTASYLAPGVVGPDHWRRWMPVTYYCSHALGPLMFITGETPKRVVAMAARDSDEHLAGFTGRNRPEAAGVMLLHTDKNAVFRVNGSSYMSPRGNWYRIACSKGGAETVRGDGEKLRLSYNGWEVPEGREENQIYQPEWESDGELANQCGHHGGDYWVVKAFLDACLGRAKPWGDVYAACTIAAVGILGWRSICNGNLAIDIPDFRKEEERAYWQDDRLSPFRPGNI